MVEKIGVLCEIIFSDPKSGVVTSLMGNVDESRLISFSSDSEEFLIFSERFHPPILKKDIKEITIHSESKQKNKTQKRVKLINDMKPMLGKIS
jgi:hypothetical protein